MKTALPVPGTEMHFDCDTLLLSVGLIPENELSGGAGVEMDRRHNGPMVYENMETSVPGIFAAGNVVHVHDLVDFVTGESQRAGAAAARFARQGPAPEGRVLEVENGASVTYTVPGKIRLAMWINRGGIFPCEPRVRQFRHPRDGGQRTAGGIQARASGPRRDGAHQRAEGTAGKGGRLASTVSVEEA